MDNDTEIVKQYAQKLPQGMKNYLAKKTWTQKLSLIAQINKMSSEQASALEAEVFLILMGIERYSDFRANIKENVAGVNIESVNNIADYIEKNIFSEIKLILVEMEKASNETKTVEENENLSKESVLHGIENPTPAKPIATSPVWKNPVLDAQHNLPEGEKKILISSAAVPSRGPILGNVGTGFVKTPIAPAKPYIPTAPVIPKPIPPKPSQPPVQLISQVQKPPLTPPQPIQPAPTKYKIDPYREQPK